MNAPLWVAVPVVVLAVLAARADVRTRRIPNLLTGPAILLALLAHFGFEGFAGLKGALAGMLIAGGLLLPGWFLKFTGAGDVKLMAGVGAWIQWTNTYNCILGFAIIGAVMAICMVLVRGKWKHHYNQFWSIAREIATIKDPEKLSELAAKRKPTMMLLPYGIPIAVATIGYFLWTGMLI